MKVKRSNDGVTIIKNNINPLVFFLTPLVLYWNVSILIAFYTSLQSSSIVVTLLIIPFLIVGIGLFYWVIINLFNRTCMFINNKIITINHKPIPNPFFDNKVIKTYKLEQLRIMRDSNNTYNLRAFKKSGGRKKLLNSLSKDEAFSIKKILENNWDIEIKFYNYNFSE